MSTHPPPSAGEQKQQIARLGGGSVSVPVSLDVVASFRLILFFPSPLLLLLSLPPRPQFSQSRGDFVAPAPGGVLRRSPTPKPGTIASPFSAAWSNRTCYGMRQVAVPDKSAGENEYRGRSVAAIVCAVTSDGPRSAMTLATSSLHALSSSPRLWMSSVLL